MTKERDDEEMVTITKREYDGLCRDEHFLQCLADWGVDNWNGYDEAQSQYREEQDLMG